ncbi:Serine/threonine-protein kinase PrkC [Polystyrenella longa]|uniref:Serine/threonine-protein kinase PrkC n=1 Tax=Polystyrenella longa TaxID=2528007 RepID=A0A518CUH7_9PLAN|nr:serine/threonine-protein kinase [Polystyrenella longa]QDU82877.1 Serine/threonine-protein kinase PrkC [Polystyrenella longa]
MKFAFAPESKPLEGYTIKRAIHRGGFGEVYYALSDAGKEVALKLLRQNTDIELRGVTQCLNLKHPNLVSLFDIKEDNDGDHWIIMEYVSGKTLDEVLGQYPNGMPLEKVSLWMEQICQGLSFLHDRGIVHRDMKPANLFIENDIIKIGDIGLSKFITQSRRSAQTQSVGTVYYMAPEVAHGRYGHEVDIYAMGIILYELFTGRVPFEGESTGEILMKHLTDKPDLTRLPEAFREVVARALDKDPQQRTSSVTQFWNEFQAALQGNTEPVDIPESSFSPVTAAPTVTRPNRTNPSGDGIDIDSRNSKQVELEFDSGNPNKHHSERTREEQSSERPHYRKPGEKPVQDKFNRMGNDGWFHKQSNDLAEWSSTQFNEFTTWYNTQTGVAQVAIIAVVLLLVFGTPLLPFVIVLAVLGLMVWGCYSLFLFFLEGGKPAAPPVPPTPPPVQRQAHPLDPISQTVNRYAQKVKKKVRHWSDKEILRRTPPKTVRHISGLQRVTELSSSFGLSTFYVAIFSSLYFFVSEQTVAQSLPTIFFLGSTTLLSVWTLLGVNKLTEGSKLSSIARRLLLVPGALLVGAAAYGLSNYLMVWPNFDFSHDVIDTAFTNQVGDVMLVASGRPTWDAYLLFFVGMFLVRGWWSVSDSYRKKKLRILSILWTGFLTFAQVCFFAFPLELALFWSVVSATVIQLSSNWTPPRDRLYIAEEK